MCCKTSMSTTFSPSNLPNLISVLSNFINFTSFRKMSQSTSSYVSDIEQCMLVQLSMFFFFLRMSPVCLWGVRRRGLKWLSTASRYSQSEKSQHPATVNLKSQRHPATVNLKSHQHPATQQSMRSQRHSTTVNLKSRL